jgi:hypothetical protein
MYRRHPFGKKTGKRVLAFRNTNLKKNSGYEHPEDVKPELFRG